MTSMYGRQRRRTSTPTQPRGGFWFLASVYALVMLGGTVPVPLYAFWAPKFGFGPFTTTLIFAVYAVGTVVSLLLFAAISDSVGRRPMLLIALTAGAVSTAMFLVADSVAWLLTARFVFGLATGIFTATATAAIAELEHPASEASASGRSRAATVATAANAGGLGLGAIVAGIFAQFFPDPTHLIFWCYLLALIPAAVTVMLTPETVHDRSRPALTLRRPVLPASGQARRQFASAAAAVFAAFAVAGLFSSLVPAFLRTDLHVTSFANIGAQVGLFFAAALITQTCARGRLMQSPVTGPLGLALGVIAFQAGLLTGQVSLFVAGTVLAGAAFGLVLRGGVTIASTLATSGRRADLLATFFLAAYAGNIVPTVTLGALEQVLSTHTATAMMAAAVIVVAVVAALLHTGGNDHETPTETETSR